MKITSRKFEVDLKHCRAVFRVDYSGDVMTLTVQAYNHAFTVMDYPPTVMDCISYAVMIDWMLSKDESAFVEYTLRYSSYQDTLNCRDIDFIYEEYYKDQN